MRKLNSQTVQILLVEDDEIDAEVVQRAFKKQKIANPIHAVCNGLNALEVLRGHGEVEPLPKTLHCPFGLEYAENERH